MLVYIFVYIWSGEKFLQNKMLKFAANLATFVFYHLQVFIIRMINIKKERLYRLGIYRYHIL